MGEAHRPEQRQGDSKPGDSKHCVVCGADCSAGPRIKLPDAASPAGLSAARYCCVGCYSDRLKTAPAAVASQPARSVRAPEASAAGAAVGKQGVGRTASAARPTAPTSSPSAVAVQAACDAAEGSWTDYLTNPGRWLVWMLGRATMSESHAAAMGGLATFCIAFAAALGNLPWFALMMTDLHERQGSAMLSSRGNWLGTLAAFAGVALLGAFAHWVLGTAFFGLRTRWSGGECSFAQARAAYFATVIPFALFGLVNAGLLLLLHGGPDDPGFLQSAYFRTAAPILGTLLLLAGCAQLWHMAWRGFRASPMPSAILVAGLPALLYVVNIALLVSGGTASSNESVRSGVLGQAIVACFGSGHSDGGRDARLVQGSESGNRRRGPRGVEPDYRGVDTRGEGGTADQDTTLGRGSESGMGDAAKTSDSGRGVALGGSPPSGNQGAGSESASEYAPQSLAPLRFRYPRDWSATIDEQANFDSSPVRVEAPDGTTLTLQHLAPADFRGDARFFVDANAARISADLANRGSVSSVGTISHFGGRALTGAEYTFTTLAGGRPWKGRLYIMLVLDGEFVGAHGILVTAILPANESGSLRKGAEEVVASVHYELP